MQENKNNKIELNKQKTQELKSIVKSICDKLRTVMEVNEYRNYVLGFLFYKYLSEIIENKINNEILPKINVLNKQITYKDFNKENFSDYEDIVEYIVEEEIGFFIDYKYTYQNILELATQEKDILELLETAFFEIERSSIGHKSEDDFKGLFQEVKLDDTKLGKKEDARESTIRFIIKKLATINLAFESNSKDVFGDAYEYLLSEFASDGGKKAGEFYTPSSVSELISKIVTYGRESFKTAYDPACGSGSLLLKLTKKVKTYRKIYGQEVKASTFNLARMNLFLRDMNFSNFDIKEGDTLLNPRHIDKKFELIVANPPFSLEWSPSRVSPDDDRYNPYPAMAPKNKADFAFLQHMLYHVDEKNGIIASIFSLGILERGNAEKKIRQYIVDQNWIDSIILLPSKMFFNTSIATCLLIAKKNKKDDKIFFVDASDEFVSGKRQNSLSEQNIEKIFDTWKDKKEIPHFSKLVSKQQIIDNDYSLSINKYVEPKKDEQENIDLAEVEKELLKLKSEIAEAEKKFEQNLAQYSKVTD